MTINSFPANCGCLRVYAEFLRPLYRKLMEAPIINDTKGSRQRVLLVTPPFTQLNTPYPATAYLKGYLNTRQIPAYQADLGIEVILSLFSCRGLRDMFARLDAMELEVSDNSFRIYNLKDDYINTIDAVVLFLQNKNPTLAHAICDRTFLPEAARFATLEDLEWAFGSMGIQDKARHLATLYLEDLGDLIKEAIDPHFGFSRYAERLGRTATHFDEMLESLLTPDSLIAEILVGLLHEKIAAFQPTLLCLSAPFPGNLFGALKCAQYAKKAYPAIKVVFGGGFANTELRSISDPRVFDFIDFISLDDGEAPLSTLLQYLDGERTAENLKRTFMRVGGQVVQYNGAAEKDVPQKDTGTPDYSDLPLDNYLSVIEVANPMHRLWSDGRWNKLTLAHGCYWGRCTFCDVSLDYIRKYEPLTAVLICDRMEEIIAQTKQNGFHFVDEAAPPNLLREVALEIIRRKLVVVWWTNIRFEKLFTADLARLLKASGCIAVAGGLEVASDRLLELMKKGVTVAQVAQVANGFTQAGIMVHAYLMYGFPTQTAQETIDALEMVRQLFQSGALQSGFWHRFAMTSHSPVGLQPDKYEVIKTGPDFGGFADNDLFHEDPKGADHDLFSEGLRKSLFNYMHGICIEDYPLKDWFDFKVPKTTVPPNYIHKCLAEDTSKITRQIAVVVWLGSLPSVSFFEATKGGKIIAVAELEFFDKKKDWILHMPENQGDWIAKVVPRLIIGKHVPMLYKDLKADFEEKTGGVFEEFIAGRPWQELRANGLLVL
jgi:hypothetical protein